MRTLVALLPGLACAVGMFFCMRMMMKGSKGAESGTRGESQPPQTTHGLSGQDHQLAELEEEVNRLRAELRLRDEKHNEPT